MNDFTTPSEARMNYRSLLPFSYFLLALSLASIIVFIYYVAKFYELPEEERTPVNSNYLNSQYGYYGSVMSLLLMLVFFNGYHITM